MKEWVIGGLILGTCLLIGGCVVVANFLFNPVRQAARIVNKTIDADNVIYNYEWFKLRHEDIDALSTKIGQAQAAETQFKTDAGERPTWKREDREEASRLATITLGLKQQRADLAAEYNAKSRMVNRSIFKAGDVALPERISLED